MDALDLILYGYLPYVALSIFTVGTLYRLYSWLRARELTGLVNVNVVANLYTRYSVAWEVIKRIFTMYTLEPMDKLLFVGSITFHWGLWVALAGHLAMLLPPEAMGIDVGLHKALALYIGGAAGLLAMVGLLILLVRRVIDPRVKAISYLDDYFALALLLLIVALGNLQTLVIRPDYMSTVSPWLQSILSLRPDPTYLAEAHYLTKAHILAALALLAYFPLGKLIHPISFLIMPTLTRRSFKVAPPKELVGGGHGPR